MGRAVQVHLLTAAQLFTAQAAGGPAARGQYGTIVMSRFNQRAWKMLLPEITPIPKAGRQPGPGLGGLGWRGRRDPDRVHDRARVPGVGRVGQVECCRGVAVAARIASPQGGSTATVAVRAGADGS